MGVRQEKLWVYGDNLEKFFRLCQLMQVAILQRDYNRDSSQIRSGMIINIFHFVVSFQML